jgi:hypothetical protein
MPRPPGRDDAPGDPSVDTGAVAAGECSSPDGGWRGRGRIVGLAPSNAAHPPTHPHPLHAKQRAVRSAHGAAEAVALHLAHHPTVGMYYVRDHVRASLPAALAARADLDRAAAAAATAATHLDAAAGAVHDIRAAAPDALAAMEASLRRSTAAAEALAAAARRRRPAGAAGLVRGWWKGGGGGG